MNELDESRGGDGAGREKIKANKKLNVEKNIHVNTLRTNYTIYNCSGFFFFRWFFYSSNFVLQDLNFLKTA